LLCYARLGDHLGLPNKRSGKLPDNLIEVRDLDFSRGDRTIFKNLNLTISQGDVTAIMGPSGTGKTTLLQLITRQLSPDRGQVLVDGVDIATLSVKELYKLRQRFGVLFQNGVVLTKLHAVGLRGAAYLMPSQLSGGMARRVALARAIAMDPDILIYDEPFVGLDPISMGVIVKLLGQINDALDITSIVVSHDVHDVAAVADYSYVIADGNVAAEGTPAELKATDSELVKQFMHGLPDGPVGFHYDAPNYEEQLLGKNAE
jgi:phospholipid/cholesterol/gamma-HCH transport system ATP-binding protein